MTISAFLIAMYVVVAAFFLDGLTPDLWPFLVSNIMIIASALFIGLVSRALRDRLARSNYLLKHALQRDLDLKEEARQQSEYVADHDQLTGLHNRKYFERHLTEVIPRLQRSKRAVAVLFIDLDDFKPVNDSHGHETGDRVLQVVAERLRSCVRSGDITARLGGDEFVVALEVSMDDASPAMKTAEETAERISAAIDGGVSEIRLTASVGIALHPFHGADASTVVAAADSQMYKVKRRGKHGVRMAPSPSASEPLPPGVTALAPPGILRPMIAERSQTMHDLHAAELFARLDDDQLAKIEAVAQPLALPAESTLFLRSDPAAAFYLLAEGRVKVYKLLRDGRTATIRHVGPRQTFAEAALFHDAYPSSAETMAPCRLYRFETHAFRNLLLAEPQLAVNLLGAMAELLALLNRRVEELLLPVPARLARYLLALADEHTSPAGMVRLPTSKRELAARLGTVPETLSRTFDRLRRGGVLRMSGDHELIEIADVGKLQRLAQY